jgi:hypothetical protein
MATTRTVDGIEDGNHPDLPCFEEEEIKAMFEKNVSRWSVDYGKTLKGLIEKENISVVTTDSEGKLEEAIFGSNIHDGIIKCIKTGGDLLEAIVGSNFDMSQFTNSIAEEQSNTLTELENERKRYKEAVINSETAPVEKIYTLKAKFAANMKLKDIHDTLRGQWLAISGEDSKVEEGGDVIDTDAEEAKLSSTTRSKTAKKASKWENSPEYAHYQEIAARTMEEIENDAGIMYLQAYERYEASRSLKYTLEGVVTEGENSIETQSKMLNLASLYQYLIACIVGKVQAAVNNFTDIKVKLQRRVRLSTGTIDDPFGANNLTGMLVILYRHYSKASMVRLNRSLMKLVSTENSLSESQNNPVKILGKMNKQMKNWKQMDLIKYLTLDNLFSIALVKSYHVDSEIRQKTMERLIADAEKIDTNGIDTNEATPLYNSLSEYIENIFSQVKDLNNENFKGESSKKFGSSTVITASSTPTKPSGYSRSYEKAAAAIETTEATEFYDGEVLPDRNLHVTSRETGKRHTYTATKVACPKCSQTDKSKKCSPFHCFIRQCHKCKMWGHHQNECRHRIVPTSGEKA